MPGSDIDGPSAVSDDAVQVRAVGLLSRCSGFQRLEALLQFAREAYLSVKMK